MVTQELMQKTLELLTKSIFFYSIFWGIGILLLWFRPRIEIFWKIVATLIFILTVIFFRADFMQGLENFLAGWLAAIVTFIKETLMLLFTGTFFIWPVVLVSIFYKADDMGAEKLLKFMAVMTLVLWILFILYVYFEAGIDKFLYENMQKMIPGGK